MNRKENSIEPYENELYQLSNIEDEVGETDQEPCSGRTAV